MISLDHAAPAKSNTTKTTKRKILTITFSFAFVIIASGVTNTWVPQNSLVQLFHPGAELGILFTFRGSTVELKLKVNLTQPGLGHPKSTTLNGKNTGMV